MFGLAGTTQQNEVENAGCPGLVQVFLPVGLATFGVFALLLATIRGRLGRSSCCPGKRRCAGFGHHLRDERAEKRKKYHNCPLVYRRVRGKEAWQLLSEHGEALDGFEEHLEVSVRVFPVSARRELD